MKGTMAACGVLAVLCIAAASSAARTAIVLGEAAAAPDRSGARRDTALAWIDDGL